MKPVLAFLQVQVTRLNLCPTCMKSGFCSQKPRLLEGSMLLLLEPTGNTPLSPSCSACFLADPWGRSARSYSKALVFLHTLPTQRDT